MLKFHTIAIAIALSATMGAASAGDGDKTPVKITDPKPVVVDQSSTCDECHHGGTFTHFWTHTVGGSIGHGLKIGASKISSGF